MDARKKSLKIIICVGLGRPQRLNGLVSHRLRDEVPEQGIGDTVVSGKEVLRARINKWFEKKQVEKVCLISILLWGSGIWRSSENKDI